LGVSVQNLLEDELEHVYSPVGSNVASWEIPWNALRWRF
jgi:hypothetical protein